MKKILKDNGLSIIFFLFFLISIVVQAYNGMVVYNQEMTEEGGTRVSLLQYLSTAHFIEATAENWESEFLQMAMFVWLSMFLYQKGSSESKDPDKEEEVDREPNPRRRNVPGPVKEGGWKLAVYKHSLCYTLFLLFFICFGIRWISSMKDFNLEQNLKGMPGETPLQYLGNAKLWSESFENWQSEFLSVFAIVVLTIFLRQKGSAQSKPVDAPHAETGS